MTVNIEVKTDKDFPAIQNALVKGIVRGFDSAGNYIARPSDVEKIEVTDNTPNQGVQKYLLTITRISGNYEVQMHHVIPVAAGADLNDAVERFIEWNYIDPEPHPKGFSQDCGTIILIPQPLKLLTPAEAATLEKFL